MVPEEPDANAFRLIHRPPWAVGILQITPPDRAEPVPRGFGSFRF